jgi:hypothetical protein
MLIAAGALFWWVSEPRRDANDPAGESRRAAVAANAKNRAAAAGDRADSAGAATRVATDARSAARAHAEQTILGRVVDASDAPVAGALVVARSFGVIDVVPLDLARASETPGALVATSGADGGFAIPVAGANARFAVTAWKVGFAPAARVVAEPGVECVVRLSPGREIVGIVRDKVSLAPIAGAKVEWSGILGGAMQRVETSTDSNGNYRLIGIPTRHRFMVEYEGTEFWFLRCDAAGHAFAYLEASEIPTQPDPTQLRVDLELEPAVPIVVHVVDATTSAPAADARVWLRIYSNKSHVHDSWHRLVENPLRSQVLEEKKTGANGDCVFEDIPSEVRVQMGVLRFTAIPPALAPASGQLGADKTKNPREVTIRCFPACALEGRVVDTESRPVAGARVWAWARDSSQGLFGSQTNIYEGKDPWSSVTGGDGTYRLERLPVGDGKPPTVSVRAETPQKVNQLQGIAADARVDVAPNQTIHVKDLVLPSEVSAAVVFVTDGHGAPVAGAHVQIEDTWCEAFTDSKGMARVHFREGGDAFPPVRMRIRAPGFMVAHTPPFIASAKEPPEIHVVLEAGRSISGNVVSDGGAPAPFAWISVTRAESASRRLVDGTVAADDAGRFTVEGLEDGEYEVQAQWSAEGIDRRNTKILTATVKGVAADTKNLLIVIGGDEAESEIGTLSGRVLDAATREPVAQGHVYLGIDGKGRSAPVRDGAFEVAILKYGTHHLQASAWHDGRTFAFENPNFVVDAVTATKPIEILVRKSPYLKGRVEVADAGIERKGGRISFLDVDGRDADFAEIAANGNYSAIAPRPGVYRPIIHFPNEREQRMGWVAEGGAALEITNDTEDVTFDFTVARAGLLAISFDGATPGSAVEVAREGGAVVARLEVARKRFDGEVLLPAGRYVVTAKGGNGAERRATATLTSGRSTLCVLE